MLTLDFNEAVGINKTIPHPFRFYLDLKATLTHRVSRFDEKKSSLSLNVRRIGFCARETSSCLISEILGWTGLDGDGHDRKSVTRWPAGAQFTRSISRHDTQFHGLPKGSLEHFAGRGPRGNYPFLGEPRSEQSQSVSQRMRFARQCGEKRERQQREASRCGTSQAASRMYTGESKECSRCNAPPNELALFCGPCMCMLHAGMACARGIYIYIYIECMHIRNISVLRGVQILSLIHI